MKPASCVKTLSSSGLTTNGAVALNNGSSSSRYICLYACVSVSLVRLSIEDIFVLYICLHDCLFVCMSLKIVEKFRVTH